MAAGLPARTGNRSAASSRSQKKRCRRAYLGMNAFDDIEVGGGGMLEAQEDRGSTRHARGG